MTRILVCGGRDFADATLVYDTLNASNVTTLIHGAARGADSLADDWAKAAGVSILRFPADWAKEGRAAGPMRNQRMLEQGRPDVVVAFPGGAGTRDMVARARKAGVPVLEVTKRAQL